MLEFDAAWLLCGDIADGERGEPRSKIFGRRHLLNRAQEVEHHNIDHVWPLPLRPVAIARDAIARDDDGLTQVRLAIGSFTPGGRSNHLAYLRHWIALDPTDVPRLRRSACCCLGYEPFAGDESLSATLTSGGAFATLRRVRGEAMLSMIGRIS